MKKLFLKKNTIKKLNAKNRTGIRGGQYQGETCGCDSMDPSCLQCKETGPVIPFDY